MRVLSKLKLNRLDQEFLTEQEMNILLGGGTPGDCCCSCNGPSSTSSNDSANNASGLSSPGCSGDSGDSGDSGLEVQDNYCSGPDINCNSNPHKC